jgi:putative serine protease PepD
MSPSLFDSPQPSPEGPAEPTREPAAAPRPRNRRRRLALALVISSFLGGTAATGVLVATGVVGNGTTTTATTTVVAGRTIASSSSGGLDAAALYKATSPGVVDITATTSSSGVSNQILPGGGSQSATATGTGFVLDAAGNIATAAHVVDGATSVKVAFQDGTTRTARVLGQDDATDVALLKVDPSGLTLHPLALGSSAALAAGDQLAAIGDPFGYERSISTGIVSGLDRTIQAPNGFTVAHAIQTDAALNPGNSGGPIVNASGEVVGIADQIATGSSTSDVNSGVGFAVPIDLMKSELAQLKTGKAVSHAYLGASTSGDGTSAGALVAQVSSGGPAANAGLRAGDHVTALGSTAIDGSGALVAAIGSHAPGDAVTLTVKRGSQTLKIAVTLGTQPSAATSQTVR